ncbi:MAG TPA: 3D domain-containing protein [Gaiellaceae bacterium]|jgi:3D (Asp-Asp-Asp) domain-containing protein
MRRVSTIAAVLAVALVSGLEATAAGPTLNSLESQRRAAVLDLYALDSRVAAAEDRLSALQQQAAVLRAQQLLIRQQLSAAHATLLTSRSRLAETLRDLYKRGNVSAFAVVLGAKSLDDAVSQLDTLNTVATQNEQVARVTTRAQARLGLLRVTLSAHRTQIAGALAAARQTLGTVIAARTARVAFISRLQVQEQVKRAQIAAWEARVARAQQKAAQLTAAAAPAVTAAPAQAPVPAAPPPGGRALVVTSTGYSLPGHTATGLPVGWGVVAVDPSVIPLGTKLTIPGYGEGVAADVGSGVRGKDIDLWFPTLARARGWGRRTVTITLH